MTVKAIFFDMDGTLIDTEPSAVRVLENCFRKWNLTLDAQDATFVAGRTWDSALAFIFEKYKVPGDRKDLTVEILKLYRTEIETNLFTVPGSVEAVNLLVQHFPLALVSGSRRSDIQWALNKLQIIQHFKIILGAEDYPRSKPAPDGYLKAAHELGMNPSECLVFEDSSAGIASAKAAGMKVIAVTSTNHFHQDISGAHSQIVDFKEFKLENLQHFMGG